MFFSKVTFSFVFTCSLFSLSTFVHCVHWLDEETMNSGMRGAASNGHVDIVKLLLERGSNPNDKGSMDIASENGHIEVIKALFQYGANVDPFGNDAIALASKNGHLEVVKLLMQHGAKAAAGGNAAIVQASENGHNEVVEILLQNGADLKGSDNEAILLACKNGHLQVVKLLLKQGADPNARDHAPLLAASENNRVEVVKFLLINGANAKGRDNSAIIIASENGHDQVVKLLLEYGAEAKARDNQAVWSASGNGHADVVKILLENGADPKARDNDAIIYASKNAQTEVVKLLLKHGADPRARDSMAIRLAVDKGHSQLADLLLDHVVQKLVSSHFVPNLSKDVLSAASAKNSSSLIAGVKRFSISLNLIKDLSLGNEFGWIKKFGVIDKLCSVAKEMKLEFAGLNATNVSVLKTSGSDEMCLLDLVISWPSDLSLLVGRNLSLKGQFLMSNGSIGIRPLDFGTALNYPKYTISHPSISNTSVFFVGESLNLNLKIDQFKAIYYNIVDGNQFRLQMNNQTFIKSFNMTASQFVLKVTAKSLLETKEKFQPFISFSINGTEYRINVMECHAQMNSFNQPNTFFELPKRTFGLNEGISVNWIKTTPYVELLKRNISFQLSRTGSNSSVVFLKRVLPQTGFVSFPPLSSLLNANATDLFGSYVVKLKDMDGIIAFGEEAKRSFEIVRPSVDRIGLNQSVSDDNVTVSVFWESQVCSALANITKLNGILKANLTVSMQNESIYSVDLESYCILAHQFELPTGNLSFNTNYELKVTLFDTIEGILLATGNGTLFIAREEPIASSQETDEANPLKQYLIIGGIVLGVLLIVGIVAVLIIVRKRRLAKLASNRKMDTFSIQSNSIFSITNVNQKLYSY